MGTPMYLDMQATTPLDPRVVDAMLPFMTGQVRASIMGDMHAIVQARTGIHIHVPHAPKFCK